MAGEAEWAMGWPNTAQKRVLALMGSALRGDTGQVIVDGSRPLHANKLQASRPTPVEFNFDELPVTLINTNLPRIVRPIGLARACM